jgi:dipeptidyl-peptidase-4
VGDAFFAFDTTIDCITLATGNLQRLVNRLVELGKSFDFMEYPNRSHAISEGEGTSLHVHSLLARYLLEHLPPGPLPR